MLLRNESLRNYNSWRIGGLAKQLFIPENIPDLQQFLTSLPKDENIFWVGLGSNLLVRESGFNGTVIITQGGLSQINVQENNTVRIEAGVACGSAARICARSGLTGIEFLAGVPGTLGGALAMNAGAHGSETWQFVSAVEMINRQGEIQTRLASDFKISYRQVIRPYEEWFLAGILKLISGEKEKSLAKIKDLLAHRSQTQPINLPNCGSVFRNPPNHFAAKLIESCNLKDYRIGGAVVSVKHANFITTDSTATSDDIENLILHIQQTVFNQHNIKLIPEVHILGDAFEP